jgi:mannose-6-phosphate isomerase-like protein (cupin superfamily)
MVDVVGEASGGLKRTSSEIGGKGHSMYVLRRDELPTANEFEGVDHGDINVSFLLVDAGPGDGPALHRHGYAEVFIVLEGEATYVAGDEERRVEAGEIVVVPPDTPHRFFNSGRGLLRQVDIHTSPRFVTEWLDAATTTE